MIEIREAKEADAAGLLAIYAPYVEHTAITFEYEVPTLEEFTDRIRQTKTKYPYLVAKQDGKVLGYAYAGQFHAREAYAWAVETSIYVDESCKHMGIGGKLHAALEKALKDYFDLSAKVKEMHAEIFSLREQRCRNTECELRK